jgi:hypothetical protein
MTPTISLLALFLIVLIELNACGLKDVSKTGQSEKLSPEPSPTEDPLELSEDEYDAILSIVSAGPIVIISKTDPKLARVDASSVAKDFPSLKLETIEDFKTRNATTSSVECKFPTERPCSLLNDEDIRSLWDFKSGQTANEKWDRFRARYGTDDYYLISRFGFDSGRTEALAYVVMTCGTLCRNYTLYHLVKENGNWKVAKSVLTGVE